MDVILIEVFLPAGGRSFEIRLPKAMNCLLAANLTARALRDLLEGEYFESSSSIFVWKDSGRMLNAEHSLEEENVKNGSKLLLI